VALFCRSGALKFLAEFSMLIDVFCSVYLFYIMHAIKFGTITNATVLIQQNNSNTINIWKTQARYRQLDLYR
jgi:hypothetical protein